MSDLIAIERATLDAWRARHREERDGWVLQADGGVTGRPNAISPLAFTGADIETALDGAEAWCAARGMVPQFKLTEGATAPADLAAHLTRRGYHPHTPTLIMTRALTPRDAPASVALSPAATPAFAAVFADARTSDADHAERWAVIQRAPQPKAHAVIELDGRPAAIGLCIVTGAYAGLFAMRTPVWARRKGLALKIVDALIAWAPSHGATTMYLQVEEPNTPAIALYERAGFTALSRYVYWKKAP